LSAIWKLSRNGILGNAGLNGKMDGRAVGIDIESLHYKSRKKNDVAPPPLFNWILLEPRKETAAYRPNSDEKIQVLYL
jgi:hypothetical protein